MKQQKCCFFNAFARLLLCLLANNPRKNTKRSKRKEKNKLYKKKGDD